MGQPANYHSKSSEPVVAGGAEWYSLSHLTLRKHWRSRLSSLLPTADMMQVVPVEDWLSIPFTVKKSSHKLDLLIIPP